MRIADLKILTTPSGKPSTFYDKKGYEIREWALLKWYHFTDGRGKKHFMFKRVRIFHDSWVAECLGEEEHVVPLWACADGEGFVQEAEIIDEPDHMPRRRAKRPMA